MCSIPVHIFLFKSSRNDTGLGSFVQTRAIMIYFPRLGRMCVRWCFCTETVLIKSKGNLRSSGSFRINKQPHGGRCGSYDMWSLDMLNQGDSAILNAETLQCGYDTCKIHIFSQPWILIPIPLECMQFHGNTLLEASIRS